MNKFYLVFLYHSEIKWRKIEDRMIILLSAANLELFIRY